MVVVLVGRLTSSRLVVAAAGAAFLAAFELWLWIPYVLSDVSFMFLSVSVLYLLWVNAQRGSPLPIWRSLLPLVLALLAVVYRPAGLPILLVAIVGTVFGGRVRSARTEMRIAIARWTALSLIALIGVTVALDAALMADPARWPFPFLSGWIQEVSREYRQGVVIYGRPATYHSSPTGLLDYVWLILDRLRSFFVFSASGFSRGHILANVAFFVPVYLGWLVALISLVRAKSTFNWATWWATALGTLFVVFFWVFHSLQYIDYDWRYRLPCLPVVIMLGSIGWHDLIVEARTVRHVGLAKLRNVWRGAPLISSWLKADGRRDWLIGGVAALLAGALMALITSIVYSHDSKVATNLHATTLAVVTVVNKPNYDYGYGTCIGFGTENQPPTVGTQVRIFYNPNDPCQNLPYDPVALERSDLIWLLVFSAVVSLAVGSAAWDFARQR